MTILSQDLDKLGNLWNLSLKKPNFENLLDKIFDY